MMKTKAELQTMRKGWEARIADFRASGLPIAAWCQRTTYTPRQLGYWLRKYSPMEDAAPIPLQETYKTLIVSALFPIQRVRFCRNQPRDFLQRGSISFA